MGPLRTIFGIAAGASLPDFWLAISSFVFVLLRPGVSIFLEMLSSCILLRVYVLLPPSRPFESVISYLGKLCDLSFWIYTCCKSRLIFTWSMLGVSVLSFGLWVEEPASSAAAPRLTPLSRLREELLLRWLERARSRFGVPVWLNCEPLLWASISSAVRSKAFMGPLREEDDLWELRWPGVDCGLCGVLCWLMAGRLDSSKVFVPLMCLFWDVRYCMLRLLREVWEGGAWPYFSGWLTGSGPPRLLRLAADLLTRPEWRLACDMVY